LNRTLSAIFIQKPIKPPPLSKLILLFPELSEQEADFYYTYLQREIQYDSTSQKTFEPFG
jgi:hypothetical protein